MKYDVVQQCLEEFVQANWSDTVVQYDNVAFNSDIYSEYSQFTVVFGDADQTTVTRSGCFRIVGAAVFTVNVKPGQGTQRLLELVTLASLMLSPQTVSAIPPLVAPQITLHAPSLFKSLSERAGWVWAQLTVPFYYDLVGA